MRMASGWRSTPFRLRCRSATRSRRLMAAARTGRACGWLSSMVALPPIAAANGPTSMACATTWSAANPDRKALLCCRAVGWSNAALGGLRIGAACCATAPDGWMSQPGVSPSPPFCLVLRHCSIQCQSVPLDYENPTQTGSQEAQADIKLGIGCSHHIVCYLAMLDYAATMQALNPVPAGEEGSVTCIRGPRTPGKPSVAQL